LRDEVRVLLLVFLGAHSLLVGRHDLERRVGPRALLRIHQVWLPLLVGFGDRSALPVGGRSPARLLTALLRSRLLAETVAVLAFLAPLALIHHPLQLVKGAGAPAQAVALPELLGILLHLFRETLERFGKGLAVHRARRARALLALALQLLFPLEL